MYLHRAVDLEGKTLEFLLSPMRDAEAAKRFLLKALCSTADSASQTRLVEEQMAQPTALTDITSGDLLITSWAKMGSLTPLPACQAIDYTRS